MRTLLTTILPLLHESPETQGVFHNLLLKGSGEALSGGGPANTEMLAQRSASNWTNCRL
jgi:hypothetical protein